MYVKKVLVAQNELPASSKIARDESPTTFVNDEVTVLVLVKRIDILFVSCLLTGRFLVYHGMMTTALHHT
jgi:hypothetical protein